MQTGWRKRENWEWAKEWASLLHDLLPEEACEAALATCRITLQGPKSVGEENKNWGRWIRMRMQTGGNIPRGIQTVQRGNRNWISTDSHAATNVILECFGLTLDDVFNHYGEPEEGQVIPLDLCTVIQAVAPDFAATAATAVA